MRTRSLRGIVTGLSALGACFAATVQAQGTLVVPAGTTVVLSDWAISPPTLPPWLPPIPWPFPTVRNWPLVLDALIMEDDSTLVVFPLNPDWTPIIGRLKVGNRAKLRAEGGNGPDASQAFPGWAGVADYCDQGSDTSAPGGANGGRGGTGTAVRITTGLESIGDLTVFRGGGNGGLGQPGGGGEKGGQARCYCSAGGGGKGGRGGAGGDGGGTSDFNLRFYWLAASPPVPGALPGLKKSGSPAPGRPGAPGGPGGAGGDGACGRGHGGNGWPGDVGTAGRPGAEGQFTYQLIPKPLLEAERALASSAPLSQRNEREPAKEHYLYAVAALKEQFASMKGRGEAVHSEWLAALAQLEQLANDTN